ncbi:MAG: hemolysin family protein [Methanosarcinaceae archaeon]|nr:hemolysin family protein [Methanosarcinaceae archaeon]MDF1534454.1 hemolysin family protein [Methanosarcinaceae archaeon]
MVYEIPIIEILIVAVLVSLSAFFSSAETAFVSVNRIKMLHLSEKGNKSAKIIHEELRNPEKFITTILVGNNIVNVAASVLVTAIVIKTFGSASIAIAIATGIMTIIILVFGEIVPKTFAAKHADTYSLKIAKLLLLLTRIMHPVVFVFTEITQMIFRVFGIKEKIKHPFITEEQIKVLMRVGVEEGVFERHEREYIKNIFEFTDEDAEGIMTPRINLECVENKSSLNKALKISNESGHSRLPVWKDNPDNVIGMMFAKDLLRFSDTELGTKTVDEILRPILIVRAQRKIASIFRELQAKKMQIAVVTDTNQKVIGIMTIEDILEEIVGEILDEYDVEEIEQENIR